MGFIMNGLNHTCPICEEGKLLPKIGVNHVNYRGQKKDLELHFSSCDVCGCEQADAAQLSRNKRAMVVLKKQIDGVLKNE